MRAFTGLAVAAFALSAPVWANSVLTNGGFETGDYTGWVLADSENEYINYIGSYNPFRGRFNAYFGNEFSPAYISQDLPTVAGVTYQLSWWLHSDGGAPSELMVRWAGLLVCHEIDMPQYAGQLGYSFFSYRVTAAGSSTLLEIGAYDRPGFVYLDDVSVVLNGEPSSMALLLALIPIWLLARRLGWLRR